MLMAVLYAGLGAFIERMKESAVLLLMGYGLTYFFSNFGPNSTTFILPSETFPPEVRSSLNGFCAACGKLGATIGSAAFKPVLNFAGTAAAFWMCPICAILGVVLTVFFIEDLRCRDVRSSSALVEDITLDIRLPSLQDDPRAGKPEARDSR